MIEKEILEKLYVKEGKTQQEIANILVLTQTMIHNYIKKYELEREGEIPKNHYQKWTTKDKEYLIKNYGVDSIGSIAKHLKRTTRSVIEKIRKMELGEAKHATEYINATELAEAIGRSKSTVIRWINNRNLPSKFKIITEKDRIYRIEINKFWKWCEKNLNRMKWELYERNSLGIEPKWLDEEIKRYNKNRVPKSCKEWSKTDLCYLEYYYKQGLQAKEIAQKLERTKSAVEARLGIIKVERKTVNLPWKPIEIEMLLNMRKEKVTLEVIADKLGRSLGSVTVKSSRLKEQIKA